MNFKKILIFVCFLSAGSCLSAAASDLFSPFESEEISAEDSAGEVKAYNAAFYKKFIEAAYNEKQGEYANAFKLYEELFAFAPKDEALLHSLAAISAYLKDYSSMDKYISAYYAAAPADADALALNAALLQSKGKLKEAASFYKAALDKNPDSPEIVSAYISLLMVLDQNEAIEYLEELGLRYPAMKQIIAVNVADVYLRKDDVISAVNYLERFLENNPYSEEVYPVLANIYEVAGKPQEALRVYLGMENMGLASADILVKIGAYYVLAEKREEAAEYFKKAKKMDKNNPAAAQFLVLDAQDRNDYEYASELLRESASYDKEPSFHIRASYFLSRAGKREEANALLKQAYAKFPENSEIAYYYALSLMDTEKFNEAEKIFSSLLEITPDGESVLLNYAFALERQKKYKKMEKQLKKLLELNGKNAEALNFYGYYLVNKTKRIDEGGKYIQEAVSLSPNETAFLDSLAWYRYKKGDFKEAYEILTSLPKDDLLASNDAELWLHLGACAQKLELWGEAEEYYKFALDIDPENKEAKKNLKKVSQKL